jgi:L-fuculose-phosphate aldolase
MGAKDLRDAVIDSVRELDRQGYLPGSSGNVSARTDDDTVLVTPSGLTYAEVEAGDLILVDMDGNQLEGKLKPSTETPMHTGVYRARPDVRCIVHTHSRFCTVLACLGMEIPPMHYMLATINADGTIPLAPYATYGTEELAQGAADALGEAGGGCLLANHGMLAVGTDPAKAVDHTVVMEEVAAAYYHALTIRPPNILNPEQVAEVAAKISGYGQVKT